MDLKARGVPNQALLGGLVLALCGVYFVTQSRYRIEEADEFAQGWGPEDDTHEENTHESFDPASWLWAALCLGIAFAKTVLMLVLPLTVMIVARQRSILYAPDPSGFERSPMQNSNDKMRSPACWNLPFESVRVTTEDGVKIHGWFIYQRAWECGDRVPFTFIYFHGNAGNIGWRLENVRDMHKHLGANIFIIDYRGYGDSQDGEGPTEAGLAADAMAAYKWLAAKAANPPPTMRLSTERLVIFGRSLGGAVGIRLASDLLRERLESPVEQASTPLPAGIVLENTFTCLADMALELFPFLSPLKPILRAPLIFDEWRSGDHLEFLCQHDEHWCCCLLSGLEDKIVPPEQMKALHGILRKRRPRVLKFTAFPRGGHNDTPAAGGDNYWASFKKFMDAVAETEADRTTGREALG